MSTPFSSVRPEVGKRRSKTCRFGKSINAKQFSSPGESNNRKRKPLHYQSEAPQLPSKQLLAEDETGPNYSKAGRDAAAHFLSALQRYERDLSGLAYEELPSDLFEAPVVVPVNADDGEDRGFSEIKRDESKEEKDDEEWVDAVTGEATESGEQRRYECGKVRNDELDLSHWTLVVTDKCLGNIAERNKILRAEAEARFRLEAEANGKKNKNHSYMKGTPTKEVIGWYRAENLETSLPPPSLLLPSSKSHKPPLRSLDLSGAALITDSGLAVLAEALGSELRVLGLENTFRITAEGLRILVRNCPNLLSLDLSGCLAVSGTGFAIIGQHAPDLRRLRLSGCRSASPWAFGKIFAGCTELREVDASYCARLTDRELEVLADGCGRSMRTLNLRDCSQLSDVGILSLSKGCPNLKELDLGRSDLVFKVTDVSLLALAEGCRNLASVALKGCEMITDAGLSWLARGCGPSLCCIDLTNCNKITNGGIRYLGEECPCLHSVTLTNLKKVSDVGLRYLADGCHELEALNVSGMYLLGDGIDRNFGFEGLQALARSKCAPGMRTLNLHGCFRVCRIALKSVAAFVGLKSLTLSGCNKLTSEGLMSVADSCRNVRHLILAGCGECVSDSSAELLANSMAHLERVDFRDCPHVGRGTMAALGSNCPNLRRLNVSGCSAGITDDAILALCSSGQYNPPGLESLDISRCGSVTNLSMSYIADHLQVAFGLDVTLVTLSLRGTGVSSSGISAVRDRFPRSSVKKNDSFFGFWPLPRPDDRLRMADHRRRAGSASRIQAAFRAMRDRKTAARFRGQYCRTKIATKIAAQFRGRRDRASVRRMRYERWKRHVMAVKLQCFFRTRGARKRATRMRHRRWLTVAPYAATIIQRRFRGMMGRRKFDRIELERQIKLARQEEAAVTLQSAFRRMRAVMVLRCLQRRKSEQEAWREACSVKLQTVWRMYKAREVMHYRRFGRLAVASRRNRAASMIRTCWRKHEFRLILEGRVIWTGWRNTCAKVIQKWYRERCQLIAERLASAQLRERERESASIVIQCSLRRRVAYLELCERRRAQSELEITQQRKGFILSRWWRLCLARHRVRIRRCQRMEELRKVAILETWAATEIAAAWRGKQGRDKAKAAYVRKQQRWKQLWSSEDNKHFYYNQITGETRWRKPQALLDLEPRPICSNCNFYDAKVECSDCSEFFCSQCWDAVHFGGRRSTHAFRALYDYYDRRVDYGDNEFPSIWPTEIEQDDQSGWHVRVAPSMVGRNMSGNWNMYKDGETGRTFYHNEKTEAFDYHKAAENCNSVSLDHNQYYCDSQVVTYFLTLKTMDISRKVSTRPRYSQWCSLYNATSAIVDLWSALD